MHSFVNWLLSVYAIAAIVALALHFIGVLREVRRGIKKADDSNVYAVWDAGFQQGFELGFQKGFTDGEKWHETEEFIRRLDSWPRPIRRSQ